MKKVLFLFFLCCALVGQAATVQERVAELTRKYSNCLVLVRDTQGAGSGFVAQLGTRKCLFTNQHVVAGMIAPTFTLPNQTRLTVGSAAAAVEHDILTYGMPEDIPAMEVMMGVDQNVAIGDEVAVLGNPDGSGVIHPLIGQIVGVGPNLVEISAQIVPGSSGSPVVHLRSGKVIAVASYLRYEKADFEKGRMVDQVRRFCYRLDSIKKWEPVRWGDYQDEAGTVAKVRLRTLEICAVLLSSRSLRLIDVNRYHDPDVKEALRKYQQGMQVAKGVPDRMAVAQKFVKDLRSAATVDMDAARRRIGYDYFTKMLALEDLLRQPFPRVLEQILVALPKIEAELTNAGVK